MLELGVRKRSVFFARVSLFFGYLTVCPYELCVFRCVRLGEPPRPLPPPPTMRLRLPAEYRPKSVGIDALGLARMPMDRRAGKVIDWSAGIRDAW